MDQQAAGRPLAFGHDGLAPTNSLGLFLRGGLPAGDMRFNYAVYASNGPSVNTGEDDAEETGMLHFNNWEDVDDNKAVGGRVSFLRIPALEVGYSIQYSRPTPEVLPKVDALLQAVGARPPLNPSAEGGPLGRTMVSMTNMPAKIGPYTMTRELGRGGMGVVYLARDTRLDRQVAIKALPDHLVADPDRLARFEREARIVASLNHPRIASVYALEEHKGKNYLVMEYLEGQTLAERLQRDRLPVDESIGIAIDIAAALEAAHEKGVIHRDLKPGNIMITPEGKVKVLDFGLARTADIPSSTSAAIRGMDESPTITSPARTPSPTIPGAIMGTAGYMSPEQARGKPVDKRTDIFSFGCVLYEMLTGQQPFSGETVADSIGAVLHKPIDLAPLPPTTPALVRYILERCLERDQSRRYRDIGDVGFDLARATSAASLGASNDQVRRMARANRVAVTAAAIAVVGALALATMLWRQVQELPDPPEFEKLTLSIQFVTNARFTPHGHSVVFSAARDRMTSELFVRRPEDLQPSKIGGDHIQLLAVSSRGELAVLIRSEYLSHRTYIGTLARMPLTDAQPREVLDHVTAAAWTPDGSELAVIRRVAGRSQLEYPIGKVLAESPGYLSDLRISPDGEMVAFMEHDLNHDNRGPVVIVDRTGMEVARSPHYRGEEGLAWAADGKSVLYSAQDVSSDYMIWALALNGTVRDVLAGAINLIVHDVHSSGKVLVSTETNMNYLVASLDGQTGEREVLSLEWSYPAAISADGRSLLFTDESVAEGPNYAVRYRPDPDAQAVRLGEGTALDLSPDGRSALVMIPAVPPRLMIYAIRAGAPIDISINGFVSYRRAWFFPDGMSLLVSGAESGKGPRCYVLELENGLVREVTPEGTDEGRLSPDGLMVVARRVGGGWSAFSVAGGNETSLVGLDSTDEVIRWSRDGQSLLVFAGRNVSPRIERFDMGSGQRTTIQELAAGRAGVTSVWNAEISADEKSYAYTFDRSISVLYAVEGVR